MSNNFWSMPVLSIKRITIIIIQEWGIILEDLHDENVLTRNEVLYFIDTVFYVTDAFWDE